MSFEINTKHQSLALDVSVVLVFMASVIGFAMIRRTDNLRMLALPQVMLDPLLAGLIVFATGAPVAKTINPASKGSSIT